MLILRCTNQLSIDAENNMDKGKSGSSSGASKAGGSGSSKDNYKSNASDISKSVVNQADKQFYTLLKTHETLPRRPLVRPADCPCVQGKLQADITGRMDQMKKKENKK